jgi:hypothetical protein
MGTRHAFQSPAHILGIDVFDASKNSFLARGIDQHARHNAAALMRLAHP